MKRTGLALLGLMAATAGGLPAQEAVPGKQDGAAAQEPAAADLDQRIRDLGSDSYRDRTRAEKALRAMGEAALPQLRAAAADDADPEVQWRARRLVRQIEGRGVQALERRGDRGAPAPRAGQDPQGARPPQPVLRGWPGLPEDMQRRFDELFLDLERDFGMDIPRRRFFDDDFFHDLEAQMQALQQGLQQGLQGGRQQGMSLRIADDGVRLEQKSVGEDGAEQVEVFEAPDLETFRQRYPGMLEKAGMGGFAVQLPLRLRGGAAAPRLGAPDVAPLPPVTGSGPRLGVICRPSISAELLEHLGIDGGLMVEQVQPGSLAATIGVKPSDIVVQIGQDPILRTEDVQRALGKAAPDEEVAVTVLRRGQSLVLKGKPGKPGEQAATPDASPFPLQPRGKDADSGGR